MFVYVGISLSLPLSLRLAIPKTQIVSTLKCLLATSQVLRKVYCLTAIEL